MPASLSWDDLKTFLAILDHGSIGAAARSLGVNHSTVLRHVASLEAALGQRLFDRLPNGYTPTAEGRELADRLAGVAEQIDAAQRRAGAPEVRGVVRLTTSDTLAHALLLPALASFRHRHPAVELQLTVDNALRSLTRRDADVALRATARPPENLVAWQVGVVRTAPYASRRYAQAHAPDRHDWVVPDDSLAHLDSARWLRERVPAERIALRVDSLFGVAAAVRAGLGVGLVQCPLAAGDDDLVRLDEPVPVLDTPVWLLTHPDLRPVRRVRALIDFLREAFAADPRLQPPPARGVP